MRARSAIILVALCPAMVSCSRAVSVQPYSPNLNRGIVYALPKRVLDVNITYTVTATTRYKNGVAQPTQYSPSVQKPVIITPRLVADSAHKFVISGRSLDDNIFLDSDLSLSLSDAGYLTTADLDATDRSLEVGASIVSAGVQAFKLAAAAKDAADSTPLTPIIARISELYVEIGAVRGASATKRAESIKELQGELDALVASVKTYQENNRVERTTHDVEYTTTIDFARCSATPSVTRCTITPKRLVDDLEFPSVTLSIPIGGDIQQQGTSVADASDGIVYRVPAALVTEVHVGETLVANPIILYPQYGGTGLARLASKRLGHRTTKLGFSEVSGGLKSYGSAGTTSADKAAKSIETTLAGLQQMLLDTRYNQKIDQFTLEKKLKDARAGLGETPADPSADIKKQKDAASAELELLKIQVEMEKLKKELEDLKKKKDS
ncbi:MAG: hypothetical protein JWO05_3836 [Gemmatimonadetes bacterium]|nr:hypothetical protein [Gemmatimonadota bacterium]